MLHEKRFPYMRYSTHDDKFHLYKGKVLGLRSFEKSKNYYEYYIEEWLKDTRGERFSNDNLDPIFPMIDSYIVITQSKEERFEQYAREKGYFDRLITKDEKQDLLNFINNVLRMRQKKYRSKTYANLRVIREWGFKVSECSKHKGSSSYGLFRLERIEPIISGGDLDDSI